VKKRILVKRNRRQLEKGDKKALAGWKLVGDFFSIFKPSAPDSFLTSEEIFFIFKRLLCKGFSDFFRN
jgi:hypothetical protein